MIVQTLFTTKPLWCFIEYHRTMFRSLTMRIRWLDVINLEIFRNRTLTNASRGSFSWTNFGQFRSGAISWLSHQLKLFGGTSGFKQATLVRFFFGITNYQILISQIVPSVSHNFWEEIFIEIFVLIFDNQIQSFIYKTEGFFSTEYVFHFDQYWVSEFIISNNQQLII